MEGLVSIDKLEFLVQMRLLLLFFLTALWFPGIGATKRKEAVVLKEGPRL